jgi:WD40 repeat protein
VQPPRGHEGTITSVRFGDDDKTVVSTAEDGTARTWDAATGKEIRCVPEKWTPHEFPPQAALSADGRMLAVSSDETVRLQDPATGKPLGSFRTAARRYGGAVVHALRFSPDGKTLAAGTDGDVIHLWDVKAGKERCRLPGGCPMVFAADGRLLAAPEADVYNGHGSRLGIRLWDPAAGKEVRCIPSPDPSTLLYPLCFSADGRMLAGWAHKTDKKDRKKGSLVVWEVATGKERLHLATDGDEICAAAFSPDGTLLTAGGTQGAIHVWDLRTRKERACFRGDQGDIVALAFSHDGRRIASGGEGTTILLWPLPAPLP